MIPWVVGNSWSHWKLIKMDLAPGFHYPLVNTKTMERSTMLLMGKLTINGPFSVAMLNCQRVTVCYWKWPIYNWFTYQRWWFSSSLFVCLPEGIDFNGHFNQFLVGGLEPWNFMSFHSVGNVIIPTDVHSIIFQRGRLKPPTRILLTIINHIITSNIHHYLQYITSQW